jgi:hypothetical protein
MSTKRRSRTFTVIMHMECNTCKRFTDPAWRFGEGRQGRLWCEWHRRPTRRHDVCPEWYPDAAVELAAINAAYDQRRADAYSTADPAEAHTDDVTPPN